MSDGRLQGWGVAVSEQPVEAIGAAGHLQLRLQSQPVPLNPRASLVTAHSAWRAVLEQRAPLVIGPFSSHHA